MNLIKLCLRRELRSLRSLPSLLCKLAVYAASSFLSQAFVSLTLETARSRNLAFRTILLVCKTRHSGIRKPLKTAVFRGNFENAML